MNDTLFQKGRNKFVQFFFCKIIIIIYKLRIIRHRQNCLGIGNKTYPAVWKPPGSPNADASTFSCIVFVFVTLPTCTRIFFSFPIVSLNSSIRSFNGDSVCPPYTCHNVTVTGSRFSSATPCKNYDRNHYREQADFSHNISHIIFLPSRQYLIKHLTSQQKNKILGLRHFYTSI